MNATHDSDPVSVLNCHPGTRVRTLETLHEWISERRSKTRVQWVHGSAGVGKSAIAQKTAEDHRGRLVGAFFFSRNDPTRDKLDAFVATIAYQCCTSSHLRKVIGPLIIDAIRSDPNLFNNTAKVQFRKLLLEPFSIAKRSWQRNTPNLLVVDGIDECMDHPSQQQLIEIVDYTVSFDTPTPFIFLLCSRPETQISRYIENAGFASFLKRIEVSGTTVRFTGKLTESDLDIQKYFLEKFAELRRQYPILRDQGEMWPSRDDVTNLVQRASGQFIFAVTVIKFVDTNDVDDRPQDRLKTILSTEPGIIQASPYPALDLLYQQILSTCRHWDKVHAVLRLLVADHYVRHIPPLPSIVTELLQFRPGDVEMVLSQLRSVIYLPEDASSKIRILHASFTEFLLDRARSGNFFISRYSQEEYADFVALRLLHTLSFYTACYPPYNNYLSGHRSDAAITKWQAAAIAVTDSSTLSYYASQYWTLYCVQTEDPSASLLAKLEELDPYVAIALALTSESAPTFLDWNNCLQWAKYKSRAGALRTFIGKMNALLDHDGGFYIGYSKNCLRHSAIRTTLHAEWSYGHRTPSGGSHPFASGKESIWRYYQKWWKERHTMGQRRYPLVTQYEFELPENWVAVHVNGKSSSPIEYGLKVRERLTKDNQWGFDNDVVHDTLKWARENLVEDNDFVAFKAHLYELRDLFAGLAVPPSDPPIPKKTMIESVRQWLKRRTSNDLEADENRNGQQPER
ncbi:hypothetical protein VNI00_006240 [Paramarasmius palmivorus]|uniref:Nephrocystin 3-like N-terminal domain-containing protein n=1 Tax=Paramarasmius palmivorus TaxID=297713 RepID=A0AAW0D8L5_9AGAR